MTDTQAVLHNFGQVYDNPVLLDRSVTIPVVEGFNVVLASFQALYLQYQKHHFVVEGAEFYSLHEFFHESYKQVQELLLLANWQNCVVLHQKRREYFLAVRCWKTI
jgi:hypothetical protein